jgi:phosphohistidine phosphatase
MKRLLLMRHCKSDWGGDLPDEARPLNARGERGALLMAAYIRKAGLTPDAILCSSAVRTRQTVAPLLEALATNMPVTHLGSLYLASPEEILAAVADIDNDVRGLMVVGHNPGLEDLALAAAQDDGSAARHDMAEKFPTGGLAVIDFDAADWSSIGVGVLVDFKKPKTLV